MASHGNTKGSLIDSETDNEDVYTFKTPSNTLCWEFGNLLVDSVDFPATPLSAYQILKTFMLDKNHNTMAVAVPGDSAIAPPLQPPKPSQAETPQWGSPQQRPPIRENNSSVSATATIPRTMPSLLWTIANFTNLLPMSPSSIPSVVERVQAGLQSP